MTTPILSRRQPESWLPKSALEVGAWYEGRCRNSSRARWTGEVFEYERTKFGSTYWDTVEHPENDRGYDLFFPVQKIDDLEKWLKDREEQFQRELKHLEELKQKNKDTGVN